VRDLLIGHLQNGQRHYICLSGIKCCGEIMRDEALESYSTRGLFGYNATSAPKLIPNFRIIHLSRRSQCVTPVRKPMRFRVIDRLEHADRIVLNSANRKR
jgi:hypothetical protein